MKSNARAAAGRAAWAAKSPSEKARIRARLAAGRSNATRQNLTNHETKIISGILRGTKSSSKGSSAKRSSKPASSRKAATPKAATPKAASRKAASRKPSAAQLANRAAFAAASRARAATTVKTAASAARQPSPAQLKARAAFAQAARDRALAAKTSVDVSGVRGNLTPLERRKLKRLVGGSTRRRRTAVSKMLAGRNKARVSRGLAPLKRHRKSTSKVGSRSNMYIPTRANMYIETRANPKRRRRGKARRNMYIARSNPGMEKVKTALILTGLGLGSFMVTNVVQHYVGQQEFAKGAVTDYGVPAALAALVWVGPTGKFLKGNKHVGRNGQIALTAGIVGAVINRVLDGIVTNNLKAIPGIGGHLSNLLLGWPIVGEADLPVFGPAEGTSGYGMGEYVYDLPDSGGMGEYIRDPQMHSVEAEMKGLAYVDLQQRAANEEALRSANIRATQAATDNTSQFDDQFEPGF
jgi:hypothetical protein